MKLPSGILIVRFILFAAAIAAGSASAYFGQEGHSSYLSHFQSGLDGGAIGMGFISGCAFLGLAVTFIGSTKK